MHQLFSRYGGHMHIIVKGKASAADLPEDQSLENMLSEHAIQLKGFSYLSSYKMMPAFMHPFEQLPADAMKLGELDHVFMEVMLQYDIEVTTSLYIGKTKYSNVFALFIKTDLSPLETVMGKMKSFYDCPLIIRVQGKSNEELDQLRKEIYYRLISLLVYEMQLFDSEIAFRPARTPAGKLLDQEELQELLEKVKSIGQTNVLAELLAF